MTAFDFRHNAIHRAGGPQNEPAVEAVARFLHGHDSHQPDQWERCDDCWRRAGDALQALHLEGYELAQPVGGVS